MTQEPLNFSRLTQGQQILAYLKAGNRITPLESLSLFGCFRLGARIWDLKKLGHKIECEMVTKNGKHFAEYRLDAAKNSRESPSESQAT